MGKVIVHIEQSEGSTRTSEVVTVNLGIGLGEQLRIIHKNNTLGIKLKNNT